ncbi:helix-turn-helix transcriptional regulator [Streptomyces griseoluteus]|uniref:helix-turn-helix transcriptional regulator n=1 Tax=Streptomyces griseoluteus TaxID=29306 RepID=UPI003809FCA6
MSRRPKGFCPAPPGHVWISEASRLLGLSPKTLYNYRHLGKGPTSFTIGRKVAYRTADIAAYLEALYRAATHSSLSGRCAPEPRTGKHQVPRQGPDAANER